MHSSVRHLHEHTHTLLVSIVTTKTGGMGTCTGYRSEKHVPNDAQTLLNLISLYLSALVSLWNNQTYRTCLSHRINVPLFNGISDIVLISVNISFKDIQLCIKLSAPFMFDCLLVIPKQLVCLFKTLRPPLSTFFYRKPHKRLK